MMETEYTCMLEIYDLALMSPITVDLVEDNQSILLPLHYSREVDRVLPVPLVLYRIDAFEQIILLPSIGF